MIQTSKNCVCSFPVWMPSKVFLDFSLGGLFSFCDGHKWTWRQWALSQCHAFGAGQTSIKASRSTAPHREQGTRAFRTRPFRRTRTQTEVRNSDSDLFDLFELVSTETEIWFLPCKALRSFPPTFFAIVLVLMMLPKNCPSELFFAISGVGNRDFFNN
jgi:hypothetical protein